jgi:triacylglycerol lipase
MLQFDPSTSAFSRGNALYLANAADIAYQSDPGGAACELLGLHAAESFNHAATDTQGFVGRTDTFAVLAFRGSEAPNQHPKDWLADFQANQVQVPGFPGQIHAGFSKALGDAWPGPGGIDAVLRKALAAATAAGADQPGLPLFITGHSLGGALATLAACRLSAGPLPAADGAAELKVNLTATYTFGAPRVGDAAFCGAYKAVTHRVVNDLDIVPLVPFEAAELQRLRASLPRRTPGWIQKLVDGAAGGTDYRHVEQLVYIDARGQLRAGGSRPDWLVEYVRQALTSFGRSLEAPVSDHYMDGYISGLAG